MKTINIWEKAPIISITTEDLDRLYDSIHFETFTEAESEMALTCFVVEETENDRSLFFFVTDEEVRLEVDVNIAEDDRRTWVYLLDKATGSFRCPQAAKNNFTKEQVEQVAENFKWHRARCDCLSYTMLHPERVFKEGKGGKRVLNKAPIHGNDEELYHRINALRSVIQPHVSTGKGTKPTHEYSVRGFYRHYKNGKVSFVRPHTRCKGRGSKIQHEYSFAGVV